MGLSDFKIIIKSILTSSQKSLSPGDLLKDFKEVEGYDFPYEKLGFSSFLQCLMSTDLSDTVQVLFEEGGNSPQILPVLSEKSKHINLLVMKQKRKVNKKKVSRKPNTTQRTVHNQPSKDWLSSRNFSWIPELKSNLPAVKKPNALARESELNLRPLTRPKEVLLLPGAVQPDICFSDKKHAERYREICKNIKDEINCFELVESKKLKLRCLACELTLPSKSIEKHVSNPNHREEKKLLSNLVKIPLSHAKSISFSDRKHAERYQEICKNIKDEINCFELIKSQKLEFKCLPCNLTLPSAKMEKHTANVDHINKKNSLNPVRIPLSLERKISFSDHKHAERYQAICRNIGDEINFFELIKSQKLEFHCLLCNFTLPSVKIEKHAANVDHIQKKNLSNLVRVPLSLEKTISFSDHKHAERYQEICRNIGDDITFFELIKSQKLEFYCLLCHVTLPSVKMEKHIAKEAHKDIKTILCRLARTILSPEKCSSFSRRSHEKLYKKICKKIKGEIHYFQLIQSKRFEFWCLLCEKTVSAYHIENHVLWTSHKRRRKMYKNWLKAGNDSFLADLASKELHAKPAYH